MNERAIETAYAAARERYAEIGVDTEAALAALGAVPLSLHCWQGDDVRGFEGGGAALGGGLQVTGDHPGRARTVDELRADLDAAYALIPGRHRLNLHAMYGEFGEMSVDRDAIGEEHFAGWVDWCRARGLGLDFNATCFAHPRAASGYTLASPDAGVRAFWIEHVRRCRAIAAGIGKALGTPCVHNLWIPDGSKEPPVGRLARRRDLLESLDRIYADPYPKTELRDAVESKLFGIGSESFVAGSHEFYLLWAAARGMMVCLDMGHFHPTESVADKLSALLPFLDELLVHVSRGVRWDSDHVVTETDDLRAIAQEIVRADALARVRLALDYFDASVNRVAAWVIGARSTLRALLFALLEPINSLRAAEASGDRTTRLALLEEAKALPQGAVWDVFCLRAGVPVGTDWLAAARDDESRALAARR
jgi:L-rhamnose isomerase